MKLTLGNIFKNKYGLILFWGTALSILIKNIILQSYIASFNATDNSYALDFLSGLTSLAPFVVLNISVTVLALSVCLLLKGRAQGILLIIINFILSALIFLDTLSVRSFFDVPTLSLIFLSGAGNAADEALSLISSLDILYFLDFLIFIPLLIYLSKKKKFIEKSRKERLVTFLTALSVSLAILLIIPLFNIFGLDFAKLYSKVYLTESNQALTCNFSSLGYHAIDIFEIATRKNTENISEKDRSLVDDYISWKNKDNKTDNHFGQFKDKNVIVIQVESLENFVINQEAENQEITPRINSLLPNSVYFTDIHEQVRMGNSSDCDLMFLTSLCPIDSGSTFQLYSDRIYTNSFPNILKKHDYGSYYLHGASNAVWNYSGVMIDHMGFDFMKMDYTETRMLNGYIDDADMLPQTLDEIKKISESEKKYYAHVTLCSSHMPFIMPENEKPLKLSATLGKNKVGDYLNLVSYVDNLIGEFIDGLDESGVLDNTVVIIMGDHNGIHKYYAHEVESLMKNYSAPWLNSGLSSIPLIIYDKSSEQGETISVTGGQVDIMPTLLYSLGIDENEYKNTSLGRNLFTTNRSFFCKPDGTVIGNLSEKDKKQASKLFVVSDKIIRGNLIEKQH